MFKYYKQFTSSEDAVGQEREDVKVGAKGEEKEKNMEEKSGQLLKS